MTINWKSYLTCVIMLLNVMFVFAQAKDVEVSQLFAEPNGITSYNIYEEQAIRYKTKLKSILEGINYSESNQEILVLTHFYHDLKGEVSIHGKPKLSEEMEQKLLKKIKKNKIPLSRYTNQTLMTLVKVNGGVEDKGVKFDPAIKLSNALQKEQFNALDFKSKYNELVNWSREEVIPILARLGSNADPKYGGVKSVCRLMGGTNFKTPTNIASLTDSNFYYWRGMMEMAEKDQLITVSKIMMHTANGDLDLVFRYAPLIKFFSSSETSADYFLDELNWRLDSFYESLKLEIDKGIKLQDEGQTQVAIEYYQKLEKVFPKSAMIAYELFYSESEKETNGDQDDRYWNKWDNTKEKIFEYDPLFYTDIGARNGMEGYRLYKRAELTQLFSDPARAKQDMVAYADIALDVESYGLAAFIYWNCITHFPESVFEGRNILKEYLYCLMQLDNDRVVKNFRNDIILEAKKIGDERFNKMVESRIYQSFESQ